MITVVTIMSLVQSAFTSNFDLDLCNLCHQNVKQPNFNETPVENSELSCYIGKNMCATSKNSSYDHKPAEPTRFQFWWYSSNEIYLSKVSNYSALLDFNITFGPPQNSLIDRVEGFRLDFGQSSTVNVCLGNRLEFYKNRDLAFNLNCFTKFTNEVFLPGRKYKVKIRTLNQNRTSYPVVHKDIQYSCKQKAAKMFESCQKQPTLIGKVIHAYSKVNGLTIAIVSVCSFIFVVAVALCLLRGSHKKLSFWVQNRLGDKNYSQVDLVVKEKIPITEDITNQRKKKILIFIYENECNFMRKVVVMFCSILREFGINATCNLMEDEAAVCRTSFYDRILRDPDLKVLVVWTPMAKRLWSEKRNDNSVSFWELIDNVKRELINHPTSKKFAFAVFEQTGGLNCVPQDLKLRAKSFVLPNCLQQIYFWLVEIEQFTPEGQRNFETLNYDEHENGHDFMKHVLDLEVHYTENPQPKLLPPDDSPVSSIASSTSYDTDTDVHLQINQIAENQKSTFYAEKSEQLTTYEPTYYASTENPEAVMVSTSDSSGNKSTAEYLASSRSSRSSLNAESVEPHSECADSFWLKNPQQELDQQHLEHGLLCESMTRVVSDVNRRGSYSGSSVGSQESLKPDKFEF